MDTDAAARRRSRLRSGGLRLLAASVLATTAAIGSNMSPALACSPPFQPTIEAIASGSEGVIVGAYRRETIATITGGSTRFASYQQTKDSPVLENEALDGGLTVTTHIWGAVDEERTRMQANPPTQSFDGTSCEGVAAQLGREVVFVAMDSGFSVWVNERDFDELQALVPDFPNGPTEVARDRHAELAALATTIQDFRSDFDPRDAPQFFVKRGFLPASHDGVASYVEPGAQQPVTLTWADTMFVTEAERVALDEQQAAQQAELDAEEDRRSWIRFAALAVALLGVLGLAFASLRRR